MPEFPNCRHKFQVWSSFCNWYGSDFPGFLRIVGNFSLVRARPHGIGVTTTEDRGLAVYYTAENTLHQLTTHDYKSTQTTFRVQCSSIFSNVQRPLVSFSPQSPAVAKSITGRQGGKRKNSAACTPLHSPPISSSFPMHPNAGLLSKADLKQFYETKKLLVTVKRAMNVIVLIG